MSETGPQTVTVQPGQTAYRIAREQNVPLQALIDANDLAPSFVVRAGQVLIVPRAGEQPEHRERHEYRQYMVQPGDTLYSVARRSGFDVATVALVNHIEPPYVLKSGFPILLPASPESVAAAPLPGPNAPAPKPETPPPQASASSIAAVPLAPPPGAPVRQPPAPAAAPPSAPPQPAPPSAPEAAQPKPPEPPAQLPSPAPQPTASVAARDTARPAAPAPQAVPPAPAAIEKTTAAVVAIPPRPPAPAPKPAEEPAPTAAASPPSKPTPAPPKLSEAEPQETPAPAKPKPTPEPENDASAGGADEAAPQVAAIVANHRAPSPPLFYWPVRGKVLSAYGPAAGGTHNDGINIAAPEGTEVDAADSGVVAYAGDDLRGFGNLLLIRHADGWISAYAHNSELLVKKGDHVRRGQPIAKIGDTGNVGAPQLHFELRQGTRAVDPLDHLPRQGEAG